MLRSQCIDGFREIMKAGAEDQQSGARGFSENAWADRFAGNGFSWDTQEFIKAQGQETCKWVYVAAWENSEKS